MALNATDFIKPVRTFGLSSEPTMKVVKASATTWDKGALIIYTSGLAVQAADGPTTGTLMGVAAEDAINGNTSALIYPALPNAVFKARIATGDIGGDYTSLVTNRGIRYGMSLEGTSGVWYINAADTTDTVALVTNFIDAIGTNLALVEFVFVDSLFNAI